jgi:hypothetical protein
MRIERITITPQVASEMLETNVDRNRPLKQGVVAKYASDMAAGNWVSDNGETIKIDGQGRLIDGQHRLQAVIRANMTLPFFVAYGVHNDAFMTVDTGAMRTTGNIMHVQGEIDANKKAALTRNLLKLRQHTCKYPLTHSSATTIIKAYAKDKEVIDDSYKFAESLNKKSQVKLHASTMGAFIALINTDKVRDFFHEVCTGRDVRMNVIHLLRDRLISNASAKVAMPKAIIEELTLKAFVCYKEGRDVAVLKRDENVKGLFERALK